ncbi:hypothetical protein EDB80DRAFT_819683 [Ilyonectria destructans]|nr:hypothetical protein EDB80DRAFT_819683 [Ilyonectria destructans]
MEGAPDPIDRHFTWIRLQPCLQTAAGRVSWEPSSDPSASMLVLLLPRPSKQGASTLWHLEASIFTSGDPITSLRNGYIQIMLAKRHERDVVLGSVSCPQGSQSSEQSSAANQLWFPGRSDWFSARHRSIRKLVAIIPFEQWQKGGAEMTMQWKKTLHSKHPGRSDAVHLWHGRCIAVIASGGHRRDPPALPGRRTTTTAQRQSKITLRAHRQQPSRWCRLEVIGNGMPGRSSQSDHVRGCNGTRGTNKCFL